MNDLVSVVVPIYNVEQYLERCIDSVLRQTYSNLEIILVDDGSLDNSGSICDKYALEDKRIVVLHKVNGGLSDARNAGLQIIKGKYVFFVDSDDWIHADAIRILCEKMILCDSDIVIGDFMQSMDYTNSFNMEFREENVKAYELTTMQALEEMLKQEKFTCSVCGRLFKAELFENVEFPVGKLYEDQGTTYKLFLKANKICFVDLPLYVYFVRNGSIQNSDFKVENMDELEFALMQKASIDEVYPELQGATAGRLISTCFHIMFGIKDLEQYENFYDETKGYVIKYRKQAICDKRTGKKVKIGCMSSYFGFRFTRWLYCLTGVRGKIVK